MSGTIEHQASQSRWVYVDEQGQVNGQIDYVVQGDNAWHIHHTEVNPELQGQGIAKRLVDAVWDFAKAQGIGLTSSCSYASLILARKKA